MAAEPSVGIIPMAGNMLAVTPEATRMGSAGRKIPIWKARMKAAFWVSWRSVTTVAIVEVDL